MDSDNPSSEHDQSQGPKASLSIGRLFPSQEYPQISIALPFRLYSLKHRLQLSTKSQERAFQLGYANTWTVKADKKIKKIISQVYLKNNFRDFEATSSFQYSNGTVTDGKENFKLKLSTKGELSVQASYKWSVKNGTILTSQLKTKVAANKVNLSLSQLVLKLSAQRKKVFDNHVTYYNKLGIVVSKQRDQNHFNFKTGITNCEKSVSISEEEDSKEQTTEVVPSLTEKPTPTTTKEGYNHIMPQFDCFVSGQYSLNKSKLTFDFMTRTTDKLHSLNFFTSFLDRPELTIRLARHFLPYKTHVGIELGSRSVKLAVVSQQPRFLFLKSSKLCLSNKGIHYIWKAKKLSFLNQHVKLSGVFAIMNKTNRIQPAFGFSLQING